MLRNLLKTTAAATLMGATFMATPAQASDFSFNLNLGRPRPVVVYEPAFVVTRPVTIVAQQRQWVPDRYETRTEQVLVCAERIDHVWVPERCATRYGRRGRPYTVVVPGYFRDVVIPAMYETRTTSVRIPGYWQETPGCVTPAVVHHDDCDDRDDRDDRNDRWNNDRRESGRWDRDGRRDNDRRDYDRRDNDRGPIVHRTGYSSR